MYTEKADHFVVSHRVSDFSGLGMDLYILGVYFFFENVCMPSTSRFVKYESANKINYYE